MKILAFDQLQDGVPLDQIHQVAKEGLKHSWDLMKQGIIREVYYRKDKPGVVLILEAENAPAAQNIIAEFPLVKKGWTSYTVMELGNFDPLEMLFEHS